MLLACSPDFEPIATDEVTSDDADSGSSFDGRRIAPGMLAFYESEGCPDGWSPYDPASGRALVAAHDGSGVGTTVGAPLDDHVPDEHTHTVTGSATVGSTGLAGVQGCCTSTPGAHGSYAVSGDGDARDNRMPTLALQVCARDGDTSWSPGADDPFPSGTAAFFVRPACPEGWAPIEAAKGRLVAGLTMFGDPLQTVGAPLADGEDRKHGHAVSGSVEVPVASIAGSSGGTVYAAAGSHPMSGTTDEASSGLPFVQALFCGKE
ncbi:MAG: hypothetical protein EP330_27940 [Deltaproteobacteria bacterium]|nr:MAG: hypothetical protein EP330_27940 [Deltaproteobacteria bacterium]